MHDTHVRTACDTGAPILSLACVEVALVGYTQLCIRDPTTQLHIYTLWSSPYFPHVIALN